MDPFDLDTTWAGDAHHTVIMITYPIFGRDTSCSHDSAYREPTVYVPNTAVDIFEECPEREGVNVHG